ncbi:hypothetical protein KGF56_004811 [Candida oxycetoniae]|uniref:Uncharacterized protein n=1 Tax=Candida oxycetoniae TaxID=497107 RepID=A0AAI9SSK1_9ASCO|nr:uncharacterized protein KGF56_004811 [Candida oxycetoniae]KAI3402403.2 hypothetical protein KGF56_004811 [Candida oxycetoniae]
MDRLKACIEQRVPFRKIVITDDVTSYCCQQEIVQFIQSQLSSNPHYFKNFLNVYINKLESFHEEIADSLYELYVDPNILNSCELAADVVENVKYYIGGIKEEVVDNEREDGEIKEEAVAGFKTIIVKETPRLISAHCTTGLRTWEAALYLANCLNDENISSSILPFSLSDKTILELGCGTGLLGLSLLKKDLSNKLPSKVILTDGSKEVFKNSRDIVKLNNLDPALVEWKQLQWGKHHTISDHTDILVGADITYDSRILKPLCQTIDSFFKHNGLTVAVVAATVRNLDTIAAWEAELANWFKGRWNITRREKKPGSLNFISYFDPNTPEIRIYSIFN